MKRQWAELPFEKKLGVVIVPIVVAAIGVTVPLVSPRSNREPEGTPSPDGSAALAIEYRKDVGDVCERLSREQAARRRAALLLRKRLLRAHTTVRQRNTLINDTQRTLDQSTPIYAAFSQLTAPVNQRALHEKTARTWKESLQRLRAYRDSLEAGVTRERLIRALTQFKHGNGPTVENNAVDVRAGLEGLGGADCDLAVVKTVPVFTLPPVETPVPGPTASTVPPNVPTAAPTTSPEPPIVPTIIPTATPTPPPPIVVTPEPTITPTRSP